MTHIVKKYFDVSKFVIWGDDANQDTRRARLQFGFRDGNPRLTVYTGGLGVENMIAFPADVAHMATIFTYLKQIANSEPGTKMSIESLTSIYENNVATNEKKIVSTLFIGKSKEGLVYLSVIAEGKSKLIFTIKQSQWHVFRDGEKNEIPVAEISSRMAYSIAELGLNLISSVMLKYSREEYDLGVRKSSLIKSAVQNQSVKTEVVQDESIEL